MEGCPPAAPLCHCQEVGRQVQPQDLTRVWKSLRQMPRAHACAAAQIQDVSNLAAFMLAVEDLHRSRWQSEALHARCAKTHIRPMYVLNALLATIIQSAGSLLRSEPR